MCEVNGIKNAPELTPLGHTKSSMGNRWPHPSMKWPLSDIDITNGKFESFMENTSDLDPEETTNKLYSDIVYCANDNMDKSFPFKIIKDH